MAELAHAAPTAQRQRASVPLAGNPARSRAMHPVIGNQAMLRRLQAQLKIGPVDNPLERAADAAADQVMRMPAPEHGVTATFSPPRISRVCAECAAEEETLQTKRGGADMAGEAASAGVERTLRAPGRPLDKGLRGFFEPRFGADLADVRVHTGPEAAKSAQSVDALAYTVGRDIVFAEGRFAPETAEGQRLIAHELAHVVQYAASAPAVVRRQPPGGGIDPRHARGYAGEQGMGFGYSQHEGWIFVEGPSGAVGHGVTAPGFDGVAYNPNADELHLLDNKSLGTTVARSASALTRNLLTNLDNLIAKVTGIQNMPSRIRILQLLRRAREAVSNGTPLPRNVRLVVTGESGQVGRVGGSLSRQGVVYQKPGALDVPLAPSGPAAREASGEIDTAVRPPPAAAAPVTTPAAAAEAAPVELEPPIELPDLPSVGEFEAPSTFGRLARGAGVAMNVLGVIGAIKLGHDLDKLHDFHESLVSGEYFYRFWSQIGALPDESRIVLEGSKGTIDMSKGIRIRFDAGWSMRMISGPDGTFGIEIIDRDGSGARIDKTGVHEFGPPV
jgi:hypothetical protein